MKWLMNKHQSDADQYVAKAMRYGNKYLVIGKPKASDAFPVGRMILEGMVGIYDADQEED